MKSKDCCIKNPCNSCESTEYSINNCGRSNHCINHNEYSDIHDYDIWNDKFYPCLDKSQHKHLIDYDYILFSINLSRYLQLMHNREKEVPLTIETAISMCPGFMKTPGRIITFLTIDNSWQVWQFSGESNGNWSDMQYWTIMYDSDNSMTAITNEEIDLIIQGQLS